MKIKGMLNSFLLCLLNPATVLIAAEPMGTVTMSQAKSQAKELFPLGGPKITNGVRLYSIRYRSEDHTGLAHKK